MAKHPFELKMGVESPEPFGEQLKYRVSRLKATIEHYMPEFIRMVEDVVAKRDGGEEQAIVCVHQDAFAANYDFDEYVILGMAVKYVGLYDIPIMLVGEN